MKEHHISEPRINDRIRVPEVRLVGPNGEQVGIVRVEDALRLAQEADLDLVEVAPQARPPVCKLMDFGKFKYESAIKDREARKNQAHTVLKEIRLRLKIDPHDYGTKKGHVERFLNAGDKVKVMIMFRGREQSRPEMGYRLLQRMAADVAELGYVESTPKQDGRNMIMVIGPHKKKAEAKAEQKATRPPRVRDNSDDEMRDDSEEFDTEDEAAESAPAPVSANAGPTPPTPAQAPNTNPADGPVATDDEPIFVKRVTPPPSAAPAAGSSSYSSRPPSSSSSSRPPSSSSSSRPPSSGSRPPSTGRPFSPSGPPSSSSSRPPSSGPSSSGPSGSSSSGSSSGPSGSSAPSSAPTSRPAPASRPTPAARPAPAPGSATPGTAPRPGPGVRPMPGPPPKPGPARPGPSPAAPSQAPAATPSPTPSPAARPAPSPKPKDEDAPKAAPSEQAAADA
jgi:translation initiation factor IF-3